jgi:hypothetical protein
MFIQRPGKLETKHTLNEEACEQSPQLQKFLLSLRLKSPCSMGTAVATDQALLRTAVWEAFHEDFLG